MADIFKIVRMDADVQIPPIPLPDALASLVLSALDLTTLRVGWTDAGIYADTYTLEYGTDATFAVATSIGNIAATPGAGGFYDIVGIAIQSADHYIRIKATNASGDSAWISDTFYIPVPDSLTNLVAAPGVGQSIDISFDDPGEWAVDYELEWSIFPDYTSSNSMTIPANPLGSSAQNVTAGVTFFNLYYVRVRAINGAVAGPYVSTTVNV